MGITWSREDIPYDAMGDYSGFDFGSPGKEEQEYMEQGRPGQEPIG